MHRYIYFILWRQERGCIVKLKTETVFEGIYLVIMTCSIFLVVHGLYTNHMVAVVINIISICVCVYFILQTQIFEKRIKNIRELRKDIEILNGCKVKDWIIHNPIILSALCLNNIDSRLTIKEIILKEIDDESN